MVTKTRKRRFRHSQNQAEYVPRQQKKKDKSQRDKLWDIASDRLARGAVKHTQQLCQEASRREGWAIIYNGPYCTLDHAKGQLIVIPAERSIRPLTEKEPVRTDGGICTNLLTRTEFETWEAAPDALARWQHEIEHSAVE